MRNMLRLIYDSRRGNALVWEGPFRSRDETMFHVITNRICFIFAKSPSCCECTVYLAK